MEYPKKQKLKQLQEEERKLWIRRVTIYRAAKTFEEYQLKCALEGIHVKR